MGSRDPGEEIGGEWSDKEEAEANPVGGKDVKVVEWEVFHDAFVHLGGLAVNLSKARAKKLLLSEKLETAAEICTISVRRVDALEAMQKRLRDKRSHLGNAISSLETTSLQLVRARENLFPSAKALLLSAKALNAAQCRLKEADRLLGGEGGQRRLILLRNLLNSRRCELVSQLASLYPLSTNSTADSKATPSTPPRSQASVDGDVSSSSTDELPMAIAGLQLPVPIKKQLGLNTDKNEYEASATALGYVAQVVSLVASYLDVPLRYPLRLGASRSYIQDPCPATEPVVPDAGAIAVPPPPKHVVEFPLFSEGQDLTRAAYAVFLLNKDLEQILNQYGVESVGPRHTLPNLSRVISMVESGLHPLA